MRGSDLLYVKYTKETDQEKRNRIWMAMIKAMQQEQWEDCQAGQQEKFQKKKRRRHHCL